MLEGDRLIVALVRPLAVGEQFDVWPLHLTVVPWFRLGASTDEVVEGLLKDLADGSSFQVTMGEQANFGYKGRKVVRLVQLPNQIAVVEQKVRSFLKTQGAWIVDETTKVRREYRPHVTNQEDEQIEKGDKFECRALNIVEQRGEYKEVVGEIML
jgi:2'-5' RNA ligase